MNKLSKMEFAAQDKAVDLDALCQEIRERACAGEFDNQAYVSQDIIEKLKKLVFTVLWCLNVLVVKNGHHGNFVS